MTTPLPPALPLSAPIPRTVKKKRVLLIDTWQATRELRAEVMRKLGIDVDCAADIAEARAWWRADLYDLVVINMEKEHSNRDKFCDDVHRATPPQRLAFLVGRPEYLADSPRIDEEIPTNQNASDQTAEDLKVVVGADRGDLSQHWGILEASRRIAAVRSASFCRARAIRALPVPPRDSEDRSSQRTATPTSLDDLLKEELQ